MLFVFGIILLFYHVELPHSFYIPWPLWKPHMYSVGCGNVFSFQYFYIIVCFYMAVLNSPKHVYCFVHLSLKYYCVFIIALNLWSFSIHLISWSFLTFFHCLLYCWIVFVSRIAFWYDIWMKLLFALWFAYYIFRNIISLYYF